MRDDEFVLVEKQSGRTRGPSAGVGYALALARSGREQNGSIIQCDRQIASAIRGDARDLAFEYGQCFSLRRVPCGIKGQHGRAARKEYTLAVECQIVRPLDLQHEFGGLKRLIGPDGAVHWRQRNRCVTSAAKAVERPSQGTHHRAGPQ